MTPIPLHHGAIGNGRVLALVAPDTSIDWLCLLFNRLQTYANPLGLFSEDIEPVTGRLLGNFPQAYTHVGIIHAAITIGEILDERHGTFRAWS